MIKKHITNRIISLFMVILLLPWSVFVYSENAKASIQTVSTVSHDSVSGFNPVSDALDGDSAATYEDMTITSDTVLTEDVVVQNLSLPEGSVLDLSGHTLTLHGDFFYVEENVSCDAENILISVETEDYVEMYLTDRVYP